MKSETCNWATMELSTCARRKRLNIRRRMREYPGAIDRRTEIIITTALSNLDGGVTDAEIKAIVGLIQRGLKFT